MPPGEPRPRAADLPDKDLKARKAALFEDEGDRAADAARAAAVGPKKAFAEHLRDSPAAPLTPTVKAALWAAGVAVALLFAATLYRSLGPKAPAAARPTAGPSSPNG